MDETIDTDVVTSAEAVVAVEPELEPLPKIPPIQSRFLYVGVASRRAKQLRRGALPRLEHLRPDPDTGERPEMPPKLERVAMQEVQEGLIAYTLPEDKPPPLEGDS